jgi:hypothetical protein
VQNHIPFDSIPNWIERVGVAGDSFIWWLLKLPQNNQRKDELTEIITICPHPFLCEYFVSLQAQCYLASEIASWLELENFPHVLLTCISMTRVADQKHDYIAKLFVTQLQEMVHMRNIVWLYWLTTHIQLPQPPTESSKVNCWGYLKSSGIRSFVWFGWSIPVKLSMYPSKIFLTFDMLFKE